MSTVLLLRHGLTAETGSVLTGHKPGVHLSDKGVAQAEAAAARMAVLPLAAIVTSPLDRCIDTAQAVIDAQRAAGREPAWHVDDRLVEARYGQWTGRPMKDLVKEPMWPVVQQHPSAAVFPDGESMAEIAARGVAAAREWDTALGEKAIWVACSHGDVIKAVLADALGLHLDQFQRIVVDPGSVSVVRYTKTRPFVLRTNDTGGDLAAFLPPRTRRRKRGSDDAAVGGGAGGGHV
jgi:probable phosphomutase (TIGR03848 family)